MFLIIFQQSLLCRNLRKLRFVYRDVEWKLTSEPEKCCGDMSRWASVSTPFSSSSKRPRVFLQLDRNKKNIFPVSFRRFRQERKNSSIKTKILFARAINTPTSRASSVFLRVNKHDSKPISNRTCIKENYVSQINYLPQHSASANN